MMAINTVAAGGGSILHFDGARFRVGPDSAGADPGPACYRRGGPLTVTDANVCVGKIQPAHFPGDLRPGRQPAARRATRSAQKFAALAAEIGAATGEPRDAARGRRGLPAHRRRQHGQRDQAGLGAEGPRRHPLRAAMLRRRRRPARLPRRRRARHGDGASSIPCRRAVGLRHGPRRPDRACASRRSSVPLSAATLAAPATAIADALAAARIDGLARAGRRRAAASRSSGAASALRRHRRGAARAARRAATDRPRRSTDAHRARFGFATPEPAAGRRGASRSRRPAPASRSRETRSPPRTGGAPRAGRPGRSVDRRRPSTRRRCSTAPRLRAGDRIAGPALIREANATTVVEPGWRAEVTPARPPAAAPRRRRGATRGGRRHRRPDPVLLELFNNLFMNVAEQTGAVLQNTSHEREHQGAAGFLLRDLRRRGRAGGQRAAHAGASRRDGRERAHRAAPRGARRCSRATSSR